MGEQEHRKSRTTTWTLWVPALLLLYVLSIGPVAYGSLKGWIETPGGVKPYWRNWVKTGIMRYGDFPELPEWLSLVYAPLHWLRNAAPKGGMLERYLGWWQRKALEPTA